MTNNDRIHALKQAYTLMREGKLEAAREVMRPILKAYPNDADAWYMASLLMDDTARKREMLERVLAINPSHPRASADYERLQNGGASDAAQKAKPATQQTSPPKQKTATAQAPKAPKKNGNTMSFVGLALLVVVLAAGVAIFALRGGQDNSIAQGIPTAAVLPSLVPPTTAPTEPPPTATLTETPEPTATSTPEPFGYTATADWHAYQTSEANFRVTLTAVAGQS